MSSGVKNQSGQSMYRKGVESRQRLIDATSRLLASRLLTDLRVADIAREAGCSKTNFYLYFEDVLAAVLAAVENISMATPTIMRLISLDWRESRNAGISVLFVREYISYWRSQGHVLRVRTTLVSQGEERFIKAELKATRCLLEAMAQKIDEAQAHLAPESRSQPGAMAAALLAMLERVSAYGALPPNDMGISEEGMNDAIAQIFGKIFFAPVNLEIDGYCSLLMTNQSSLRISQVLPSG